MGKNERDFYLSIAEDMAHEVNTSLANMETGIFLLSGTGIDEALRLEHLDSLREEVRRLSDVVSGILDLQRSTTEPGGFAAPETELRKIARMYERRLRGKGLSITTRCSRGIAPLAVDGGMFKQLVFVLLRQAEGLLIECGGGTVSLMAAQTNQGMLLTVLAKPSARSRKLTFTPPEGDHTHIKRLIEKLGKSHGGLLRVELSYRADRAEVLFGVRNDA